MGKSLAENNVSLLCCSEDKMKCKSGKIESHDNLTPKCSLLCAWDNGCEIIEVQVREEKENS